jgi:hypothetical protein
MQPSTTLAFRSQFLPSSFLIFAAAILAATPSFAQSAAPQYGSDPKATESYRTAMEAADQKIADEVKSHSELMKNEEYLTTQIGPRLTGSPQMQAASQWTLKRFHDYGLDAHNEGAAVLAAGAWNVSQLPESFPHHAAQTTPEF